MDPIVEKRLFKFVEAGNLQGLKELVEDIEVKKRKRYSLLDAVNGNEWTVLHVAAYNDHPSIIKWLLSSEEGGGRAAGFQSILTKDDWARTALHLAAKRGYVECCQALVEGCNIENGERAELLNAVDDDNGWTALHYAADDDHASIIQWLLSSGEGGGRAAGFTSILTKDNTRKTALQISAEGGYLECCQALVEGCKIENGERAELLNAVDDDRWTVLHSAVEFDCPSIITWLLSSEEGGGRAAGFTSASITATDNFSRSALHLAARHLECLNALLSGCTVGERLTLFLCVDKHGWTALHKAAHSTNEDIIRELLLHYPETQTIVDHRDNRGMTALHRAVLGGVDEESRKEWGHDYSFFFKRRAVVVEALLTAPKKIDSNSQQQQAAVVDPNLGTKIE